MNNEEIAKLAAALGVTLIGLSIIIVSEATYIKKLEARLEEKEASNRSYRMYYRKALARLESDQLIQHAIEVGDELRFQTIVKNF